MPVSQHWSMDGIEEIVVDGLRLRIYADRPPDLVTALERTVKRSPRREAVIDGDIRLNYEEFSDAVERLAGNLTGKLGLQKGDRAAFLMGNHYLWPVVLMAILRTGAVAVPLNNRLQGPEIAYQLNDSETRVLICDHQYQGRLAAVRGELKTLEHLIVNGESPDPARLDLDRLLKGPARSTTPNLAEEDLACILYTSGTTGFPKGAMLSHRNMISIAVCLIHMLHYDETDRMLFFIPLFHVTGLVAMLLPMLITGGANVILPGFNRHEVPEVIEREGITATMGVPATFILMMDSPNYGKFSRATMRSILYGGAPSPPAMHRTLQDSLPPDCILVEGYGLTESSSNVTISPVAPDRRVNHRLGTIGVANPLDDLRVVGPDGVEVEPGDIGELLVYGPGVTRGYWNDAARSAEALAGGWLHTGDLVCQDEAGHYIIKGRAKHMINRGGENIYPLEIENVLYAHPNVLEAAVVGLPDPVMGEEVKAVIVPKSPERYDEDELRRFLADKLADYKIPRFFGVTSELPRNPGGKVMVDRLKEI